jgi:hypothetical protein
VARKEDDDNRRDYRLERQIADVLADQGYQVHQRPDPDMVAAVRAATGDTGNPAKNPDYLVEGRVFDGYSPRGPTPPRNVHREAGKKARNEQAQRVVINLQEWDGDLGAMRQQFADWPIPGMKEVKAITHDLRIIGLWPPVKG